MDAILIEINPKEDKINENVFLEIDEDINKDINIIEKEYRKKSVYILHYPSGDISKVSYGLLKGINDKDIYHYCNTLKGSSGSPILSLKNNKVIGIHRGSPKNNSYKFNIGFFIKEVLNKLYKDFYLQNENNNLMNMSNEMNKNYPIYMNNQLNLMNNYNQLNNNFIQMNNFIPNNMNNQMNNNFNQMNNFIPNNMNNQINNLNQMKNLNFMNMNNKMNMMNFMNMNFFFQIILS